MFRLGKWYLDLVTPDGVAVICYTARLQWGPLHLRYAAILMNPPGGPSEEASTLQSVERPEIDHGVLHWRADPLAVHGEWRQQQSSIRETLLRDPTGAVRWSCRMPLATAEVWWGDRVFRGMGYVESLGMTLPPTRLPFKTLRWGRHLSPKHSLVWIDWTGDVPSRWIWLDGVPQLDTAFDEDGSIRLSDGWRLQFSDTREIRNRPLLPAVSAFLPSSVLNWAGSLATLHERKLVGRSTLYQNDQPIDEGWSVYETVTW